MKERVICILMICLLLSGCSVKAPTAGLQPGEYSTEEVEINIELGDTQTMYLLDVLGERLLFAIWDTVFDEPTNYTFHYTTAIVIYNAGSQSVEKTWVPGSVYQCQSGVLTGPGTAICNIMSDITDPVGVANIIIRLSEKETVVFESGGVLGAPSRLSDGNVLIPCAESFDDTISYGILVIKDDGTIEKYQPTSGTVDSMTISVSEDRFCYIQNAESKSYFVTANVSGEICRNAFDPTKEKIDSFCLTPKGVLVSFGENQKHRVVFMEPDDTRIERVTYDIALYRLNQCNGAVLGVDHAFDIYTVSWDAESVDVQHMFSEIEIPNDESKAVSIEPSGDNGFILYWHDIPKLVRVVMP